MKRSYACLSLAVGVLALTGANAQSARAPTVAERVVIRIAVCDQGRRRS